MGSGGACAGICCACICCPMMAFSSVMVTCLARSTAAATCCWCSWDRNGRIWAMMAFRRLAISVCLCISTFSPYDIS
uniref:Putative secreted protein n=1 Tax=Ixodes ricinus TaxID=34613 RepID=A0A6B0U2Y1_IXORI